MGFSLRNLYESPNVEVVAEHPQAGIKIIKQKTDLSVDMKTAQDAYFASKMNVCKRQALINMQGYSWTLQAGTMQWMLGDIQVQTGVSGVGDFIGKAFQSKVTGEAPVKPMYMGNNGILCTEPTYKHLIIEDVGSKWGGAITMNDGMFYASCGVNVGCQSVGSMSGAVLGGEGLFNTMCSGGGIVVLESPQPREELVEVYLDNDTLKVDGNNAVAWSSQLQFSVEKTTKTLIGSASTGEGFVNVFRGTGIVLLALY